MSRKGTEQIRRKTGNVDQRLTLTVYSVQSGSRNAEWCEQLLLGLEGITFESVDAVGDAAAYETTKHTNKIANTIIVNYANKIDVLTGDLRFSLSFERHDGHDGQMYKAEAIALAQAVLSGAVIGK